MGVKFKIALIAALALLASNAWAGGVSNGSNLPLDSTALAPTAGTVMIGNGQKWVRQALGTDCTLASSGAITCTKTNNVAFGALATAVPGTGVATFLGTPTSANLAAAITDETGSGLAVFATSPALVAPNLGTPSALTLTNALGLPCAATPALTGNVTTSAGSCATTIAAGVVTNTMLVNSTITTAKLNSVSGTGTTVGTTTGTLTNGDCVKIDVNGNLVDAGGACGIGSGNVSTTGSPVSGNLTKFSGAATVTSGDISGDCTTSGTLAITCTKTSSVAFAASATTDTTNAANITTNTLAFARHPASMQYVTAAFTFADNGGM